MDVRALRSLARALPEPGSAPAGALELDTEGLAAALLDRAEADADGADLARRELLLALDDLAAVWRETPQVVDGVRRERLIRWDGHSSTWTGTEVATGSPWMVRVLRAPAQARPVVRRVFAREAAALRRVLPVVVDDTAVRVALDGWAAADFGGTALPRALGSALADLERWAGEGLHPVAPVDAELRSGEDGRTRVVALTLAPGPAAAVEALFERIDPADEGPLADGLRHAPPRSVEEAAVRLVRALAADLAARRHALVRDWRTGRQALRRVALREAVDRLAVAVPPPAGVGAVGVDLDGRITVVSGGPDRVTFGPRDAPDVVWDRAEGFRPPVARRMLRARALSPPNPSLDDRVGGDPARTELLCRWVAEGLRLRTVRMLLDAAP